MITRLWRTVIQSFLTWKQVSIQIRLDSEKQTLYISAEEVLNQQKHCVLCRIHRFKNPNILHLYIEAREQEQEQ